MNETIQQMFLDYVFESRKEFSQAHPGAFYFRISRPTFLKRVSKVYPNVILEWKDWSKLARLAEKQLLIGCLVGRRDILIIFGPNYYNYSCTLSFETRKKLYNPRKPFNASYLVRLNVDIVCQMVRERKIRGATCTKIGNHHAYNIPFSALEVYFDLP